MSDFKSIPGGICAPKGFSAAGVHCGIRHNHSKLDLALIKADVRCAGAGCYTTNKVYGAPITVDREHLKDGYAQAIVVNSGNANTCAPNGVQLAKDTCDIVAKELGIRADDVLPSSTGVIGQAMSIEPFAKAILRRAAKREKDVEFAVASSYHLPVADGAVDLLVNCFSPLAIEEFRRVLSPGGAFVYVVPSEKHLWELKQVLYDRPYPNQVKQTPYPGFSYREIRHVESVIHLPCQEDIHALFQMTPYYWKTPRSGAERLAALTALDVTISFDIHVFCRD